MINFDINTIKCTCGLPHYTKKKILTKCKFHWKTGLIDLLGFKPIIFGFSPFRGCLHNCTYCWLKTLNAYTKTIKPDNDFTNLELAENVTLMLEKELPKLPTNHLIIASNSTDLFQPILSTNSKLRDLIGLWLNQLYDYNVLFITKNGSALEYFLKEGYFNVEKHIIGVTITTTKENEALRKQYEPASSSTKERYNALLEADKQGFRKFVSIEPPLEPVPLIIEELIQCHLAKTWIIPGFANYQVKGLWSRKDYIRFYKALKNKSTFHNRIFWKDECLSKIITWLRIQLEVH